MADVLLALRILDGFEGFYSNDPADPGGETIYGIARKRHPEWPGWANVEAARARPGFPGSLRDDPEVAALVRAYYAGNEWGAVRGPEIPSQALATELFEQAVNFGPARAVRFAQEVLNAMNRGGADWPDVPEDGVMGPATRDALLAACSRRGWRTVAIALNGRQFAYYFGLARENPAKWERFFNGFLARCAVVGS